MTVPTANRVVLSMGSVFILVVILPALANGNGKSKDGRNPNSYKNTGQFVLQLITRKPQENGIEKGKKRQHNGVVYFPKYKEFVFHVYKDKARFRKFRHSGLPLINRAILPELHAFAVDDSFLLLVNPRLGRRFPGKISVDLPAFSNKHMKGATKRGEVLVTAYFHRKYFAINGDSKWYDPVWAVRSNLPPTDRAHSTTSMQNKRSSGARGAP